MRAGLVQVSSVGVPAVDSALLLTLAGESDADVASAIRIGISSLTLCLCLRSGAQSSLVLLVMPLRPTATAGNATLPSGLTTSRRRGEVDGAPTANA